MAARRINPGLVKIHRTYTAGELAGRLGVHKNTVFHWQREGLAPIDRSRPLLFHGAAIRAFLARRSAGRKRPCPPGTFYCFHCRQPREPALGMVDFIEMRPGTGNLKAMCGTCQTIMHRRARRDALAVVMPGIDVQIREASLRLCGRPAPSLNCDVERQGATGENQCRE
jgi:hypothetical protein